MLCRLFGLFLLRERLVTPSQLSQAFDRLDDVRPLLGILALAAGYMTPEQVQVVHEAQRQTDRRFGEIAIEKGYLTVETLEALLSRQQRKHVLLGQILIDEGVFSHEGFLRALEAYRRSSGLSAESYEAFDSNDVDGAVASLLAGKPGSGQRFVENYVTLFVRNVIRFVDPGVAIDPLAEDLPTGSFAFRQSLTGDRELTVRLDAEKEVFLDLARRYSRMEIPDFDELCQAAVGEFLNLVNGLFTVNCSDSGIELDMSPQEVIRQGVSEQAGPAKASVPLRLPTGLLWLRVYD